VNLSAGNGAGSAFAGGENCKIDRNGALVGMNPAAFPGMNNNPIGLTNLDGGKPASRITQKFGSLELNWTPVPKITFTSLTGYYKLNVDVDYNCYGSGSGAPACMTEKRLGRSDLTEELRAASDFSGPFQFTLGGFYQDGKIKDKETLPGNINYAFIPGVFNVPPLIFAGIETIHIKAGSFFGQLRYKILPTLELAGGARYTDEKRHLDSLIYDEPLTPFHTGAGIGTPMNLTNPRLHSKTTAPEVSLTWTATSDLTLFGDWKRAYKSGSYNIITPINPAAMPTLVNGMYVGPGVDNSYHDEKIQGFEIGIKSRLFDRQLNFNITGYNYKASNLQVGAILPAAGGLPVLTTLNAAAAKIYGVEADFNYHPNNVPGLELFGAFNWNHARFSSFPNAPCLGGDTYADGCNGTPAAGGSPAFSAPNNLPPGVKVSDLPANLQNGTPFTYHTEDLTGYPLVRAPDYTFTGGVHYEMPIGNDLKLGGGSDIQYSSKYTTILGLAKVRPYFYQPSFAKVNANLQLTGPGDRWELALIGNNLTNKLVLNAQSGVAAQGNLFFVTGASGGPARNAAGLDEEIGFVDRGREVWIKLTVKFGG
jgi:outer membrane receptor protein involved in Fe transport